MKPLPAPYLRNRMKDLHKRVTKSHDDVFPRQHEEAFAIARVARQNLEKPLPVAITHAYREGCTCAYCFETNPSRPRSREEILKADLEKFENRIERASALWEELKALEKKLSELEITYGALAREGEECRVQIDPKDEFEETWGVWKEVSGIIEKMKEEKGALKKELQESGVEVKRVMKLLKEDADEEDEEERVMRKKKEEEEEERKRKKKAETMVAKTQRFLGCSMA